MIKLIQSGDIPSGTTLMSNWNELYKATALNHIRQLIDRAGVYSKDGEDLWGEAYVDANGRNDSVNTSLTDSTFDTNKYVTRFEDISGDTTVSAQSQGSWSNTDNAFDRNVATTATHSFSANGYSGSYSCSLGKTFTERFISKVYIKCSGTAQGSGTRTVTITLQSYNGSTWANEGAVLATGNNGTYSFDGLRTIDKNVQGLRVSWSTDVGSGTATQLLYELSYGNPVESEIHHTIPSGTFPPTISGAVGKALVEDWEDGASIQYKLLLDNSAYNANSYVIITASNVPRWDSNNCKTIRTGATEWYLVSTEADDEVARAQIYKSLFYGTTGSNSLGSSISGCTAIKTSVARDVGKFGNYYSFLVPTTSTSNSAVSTGTFSDTSTNTDASIWTNTSVWAVSADYKAICQFPTGTTISSNNTTEIGTDTTADETDNPATMTITCEGTQSDRYGQVKAIILSTGTISWNITGTGTYSETDINFNTTYSIPAFTTASTFLSNQDSDWLNDGEVAEFTAFTAEPDTLIVKLISKTTSPTAGYPSIRGFALRAS